MTTLAGRRRPLLHIHEAGRKSAQAERQAVNTVCQVGTILWAGALLQLAGGILQVGHVQLSDFEQYPGSTDTSILLLLLKDCVVRTCSCCRPAVAALLCAAGQRG